MRPTSKDIAKMIDHSLLSPGLTDEELKAGCEIAKKYDVASCCVKPCHVAMTRDLLKGSDVLVFLTDWASDHWRDVQAREFQMVSVECRDITVYGVAHRNVECWIAADPEYCAARLPATNADELRGADPKDALNKARRQWGADADERLAEIVRGAPIRRWLKESESFEKFYEDCRDLSRSPALGCTIPNERESPE